MFDVVDQNTFSQFQLQLIGTYAGFENGIFYNLQEIVLFKLACGYVNGNTLQIQCFIFPVGEMLAGLLQHPLADRHNQPGVFNNRNK